LGEPSPLPGIYTGTTLPDARILRAKKKKKKSCKPGFVGPSTPSLLHILLLLTASFLSSSSAASACCYGGVLSWLLTTACMHDGSGDEQRARSADLAPPVKSMSQCGLSPPSEAGVGRMNVRRHVSKRRGPRSRDSGGGRANAGGAVPPAAGIGGGGGGCDGDGRTDVEALPYRDGGRAGCRTLLSVIEMAGGEGNLDLVPSPLGVTVLEDPDCWRELLMGANQTARSRAQKSYQTQRATYDNEV
jgi:hypothetical protein